MRTLFALVAFSLWSSAAAAATVAVSFTGTVTQLIGASGQGLFGPGAAVGDSFSGSFVYVTGPSNPDLAASDPTLGIYALQSFILDGTVVPFDPFGISVDITPGPCVFPCTPIPDEIRVSVMQTAPVYNLPFITLRLTAPAGTLGGDALPTDLTAFTTGSIAGVNEIGFLPSTSIQDAGTITSLSVTVLPDFPQIPLPAALPLMLGGLAALWGLGRAGRRAPG